MASKVTCPYCGRQFSSHSPSHLRTHGKTYLEMITEFPELQGEKKMGQAPLAPNKAKLFGTTYDALSYYADKHLDQIAAKAGKSTRWNDNSPAVDIHRMHRKR